VKTFRTVVSAPSSQLGSCLLLLALSVGCAGDDAKKVVSVGDGGEGGEAGAPFGSNTDSSPQAGTGGVSDPGSAGNGNAGEGAAQTEGGAGGVPGSAVAGASTNGEAGADGAISSAGAGAANEGGAPNFPVSSCGTGMWMAAEIGCQACPVAKQVFEMACADYVSGQILMSGGIQNRMQFVFVNLPDGVQGHEASPVNVSVEYVDPNEFDTRTVRLSTSGWSVDLAQAPEPPPGAVIIPPFVTADVCGDVFRSTDEVRFNRIGEGSTASYEMVCP
jgi:hypothetical protein